MENTINMNKDVLVVNFSYEPLNMTSLKQAVKLLLKGKAEIARDPKTNKLDADESRTVRSGGVAFPLPFVVRMLYFINRNQRNVPLTKRNVLLRDDFKCAYCGVQGGKEMTVDHVKPRAQGGGSSWDNLVACCQPCNARKRDRTPAEAGMPLRKKPYKPHYVPFVVVKRHTDRDEWAKYITLWSVSIEERVH